MTTSMLRRPIGQILKDGGFLSEAQLELALLEQKRSNELLGNVLVRMGILEPGDLNAALAIQEHLGELQRAVSLAAGVRQMLGALLVRSGTLSAEQLERTLAEQRERGGKLGEICVRLGFLDERQLSGLLAFQKQQELEKRPNPLRLGELLVTAGHISRDQLQDALGKQTSTGKKLGEVLVEEGYAQPAQVHHGLRLQHLLMTSVLAAVLSLSALTMSGCGSGGETAATAPVVSSVGVTPSPATPQAVSQDYFTVSDDGYGLIKPDFYYSGDNDQFWTIQANVARSVTDINTVCVYRIDIPKGGTALPSLNRTFSIQDGTGFDKFPGGFLVMNGQKSTMKKVESGLITFTPDSTASGRVSGTFEVTLTDYDANTLPAPQYQLKGSFNFVMGTYGPIASGT